MMSKENGFYSAIDAESENNEGKFYRWKLSEFNKMFKVTMIYCQRDKS